eukprot:3679383-Rhodomonas_salina.2
MMSGALSLSALFSNTLIDICGKIAFAASEAELDPVDVMFQQLCDTIFTNPVLAAKAAKRGPVAITIRCAALFPCGKGKCANIGLLSYYFLPRPFSSFPNSVTVLLPSPGCQGAHSIFCAGAVTKEAKTNGIVLEATNVSALQEGCAAPVSYTHLRAHETEADL